MARSVRSIVRLAGAFAVVIGASFALAQDQPAPAAGSPPATARSAPAVSLTAAGGDVRAAGAVVSISGAADVVYAAGANVVVTAKVAGDVYVAGAQVQVDATIGGHVRAAGASVQIKGKIDGGVEAAAGVILVDAVTIGSVRAAAPSITIASTTDIQQRLDLAGANVDVAGHIGGAVDITAANVNFAARTDASVTLRGGRIVIAPGARVGGDLIIMSAEAFADPPAGAVMGTVRRIEPPTWWGAFSPWAASILFAVAIAVGTILAGIVLALFGGRLFVTAVNQVRMRPGSSLLIGLVTAIVIPVIAAVLMATVAGITAGFAVLFILPILAVFGHAVAAAGVAGGIFIRTAGRIGSGRALGLLVVGAILVALLSLIPWVGPWLLCIVLLLGIGALTRTAGGRLKRADVAVP
jgi:hypothetical protein